MANPTNPDPTAQARQIIEAFGLAQKRQRVATRKARDDGYLRDIQDFTRAEARGKRQAGGDIPLEDLADQVDVGESTRDGIIRVSRLRVENAQEYRREQQELAALIADVDRKVRALLVGAKQERVAAITLAAMQLGDALANDRQANTAAETVMASAGLRPLGFENLLGGVHGRLCLTDSTLPPFDDLTREWTARGWLVGPVAERAAARAVANRRALDQANEQRMQREQEGQRRARASMLEAQRARLASGEDRVSAKHDDGNWYVLSPVDATRRFDERHGLKPRPPPKAESNVGALVGV